MKVKELFENTEKLMILQIEITFSEHEILPSIYQDQLEDIITKANIFPNSHTSLFFYKGKMQVEFIVKPSQLTSAIINSIDVKVSKLVDDFLSKDTTLTVDTSIPILLYDELPPTLIDGYFPIIINTKNIESLADIEKVIPKACHELTLWIYDVKGLLPIVKIPCDNILIKGSLPPEVVTIINKYISTGNVLKCQKELINSGFKDYAK